MSNPNFESFRPEVKESFLWEPIPEGCMLYEEETGKLLTLNSSAEAVLTHCDGDFTVAEICQLLENDFQIHAEETRTLIRRFIEEDVIARPTGE
jgi:hypothetical protein